MWRNQMALFKFRLTSGQQAPPGNTGRALAGDWIVLEADSWPADFNDVLHSPLTAAEVAEDSSDARKTATALATLDNVSGLDIIVISVAKLVEANMISLRDSSTITERTDAATLAEVKRLMSAGTGR
mgnify:CR=1 FL=1